MSCIVQLTLPNRGRQLALLAFASVLGALLATAVPSAVAWAHGAVIVSTLALLAGVSALWSP